MSNWVPLVPPLGSEGDLWESEDSLRLVAVEHGYGPGTMRGYEEQYIPKLQWQL